MTDDATSLDCPICGNVILVDESACKVCGHVVGGASPSTSEFAWGTPDPEPQDDGVDPSWAPPTVPASSPSSPADAATNANDWPTTTPAAAAIGPDPSPTADPFDPSWAPPESTAPDPQPIDGPSLFVDPPLPADTADPFATPTPAAPGSDSPRPDDPPPMPPGPPTGSDPLSRFGPLGDAETADPFAPTVSPSFLDRGARAGRSAPPEVEVGTAATVTADGMLFDRSTEAGSGPVIGDRPLSEATGPYGRRGGQPGRPTRDDGSNRRTIALGLLAVVLLGVAGWFGGRYLRGVDDAGDGTALEAAADPTDSTLTADERTDVDPGGPTSDPSSPNDTTGQAGLEDEPVTGAQDDETGAMADDPNAAPDGDQTGVDDGDGSGSEEPSGAGSGDEEQTESGGGSTPAAIPSDPDVLYTDRDTLYGSYVAVLWSAVAGGSTGSDSAVQQRRADSTSRFGENVHAVDSDGFRSLRDGTVAVVYAGGFTSALDAKQWCRTSGFNGVDDCFGVVLSDDFGPSDRGELSRVYSLDD